MKGMERKRRFYVKERERETNTCDRVNGEKQGCQKMISSMFYHSSVDSWCW